MTSKTGLIKGGKRNVAPYIELNSKSKESLNIFFNRKNIFPYGLSSNNDNRNDKFCSGADLGDGIDIYLT